MAAVDADRVCVCVCVCVWVDGVSERSGKFERVVEAGGRGGNLFCCQSRQSSPSEEMKSSDTLLFVSAKQEQPSGSEVGVQSKRVSYERGGEEQQ